LIAVASRSSCLRSKRVGQLALEEFRPVDRERVRLDLDHFGGDFAGIELVAVGIHHRLDRIGLEHALGDQAVAIEFARGLVRADLLVHQRLGRGRLVGLVVAVAPVADQVEHDVLAEALAEVERQLGAERDRIRVVAVHVQHRRADHLGDIGAVQGRTGVLGGAGGEADLVVDHDVHGAADREAACLRHLQQLHHHALAGERGVAVHQHRQHLGAGLVAAAVLARAHAAGDHRVDDLQVRWVERQRQVHGAAGRGHVGGETHVVLDVAGMGAVAGDVLELALEFVEQLARRLAERVDQHIEAAAVGHAHDHVLDPGRGGAADHAVEHRDQRVAAFQREPFLADVLGMQVALQAVGGGQALEDADPVLVRVAVVAGDRFQLFVQPAPLLGVGDVHEFGADRAGVGRLEQGHQVAQLHPLAAGDAAGEEFAVQVAVRQAMERQRQVRCIGLGRHLQRIEVGRQVAARAIGGDQLADRAVAVIVAAGGGARGNDAARIGPARARDRIDHRRMRHVAGFAALEPVEIGLPLRRYALGRHQVLLVQVLEIAGIGAELRGLGKLLQETVHSGVGKLDWGRKAPSA